MFEHFSADARNAIVQAQEAAREWGQPFIGAEHLLVGALRADPNLAAGSLHRLEEAAVARLPRPQGVHGQIPFTDAATAALAGTPSLARSLNHKRIMAAHLALAILNDPDALRVVADAGLDEHELRAVAHARAARSGHSPEAQVPLGAGEPVPVWLGDPELPIGDLGSPRTDAWILSAMLMAGGPSAQLLRSHGVEEEAIRSLAG